MMINSLSESMGPVNTEDPFSKPQSPLLTASISESNNISTSEFNHKYHGNPLGKFEDLKFEVDVEVQSPDISELESLFFDQLDFGTTNFMISSPRRDSMIFSPRRDFMVYSPKRDFMNSSPNRDFMVSSPKRDFMSSSSPIRDFMVTSPKRDLMVSSPERNSMNSSPIRDFMASPPKRDFFISSPKQEFMVSSPKRTLLPHSSYTLAEAGVHGPRCNQSLLGCCSQYWSNTVQMGTCSTSHKGKPQSPLHKVLFNSTQFVQTESLPLPTMDGFLDDHLGDDFGMYPNPTMKMPDSGRCGPESLDTAAAALPGMFDCLPLRNLSSFGLTSDEGCLTQERDVYQMSSFAASPKLLCQQKHLQKNLEQEQDSGLQLVHLLLVCAEAVVKNDYMSAKRFLQQLNQVVTPLGDSMLRVASYFTVGLATRLTASLNSNPNNHTPKSLVPFPQKCVEILKIYQILYQACPYAKFAHFTANQAIFEAFQGEDRVHVIDLDIIQGYQWPAFMQALAARPGGPPFLRITGVGTSLEFVRETGRHLTDFARSLHVPFEFHPVGEHLGDLQPHMFHRRVGEALAVNCFNRLNRVSGNRLGNLVSMIRNQAPKILTLVEQDASLNGQHFLGRFLEALHYYSAIFDSLEATFPADSPERAKVEEHVIGVKIRNIVACEGLYRLERHERLETWRKIMEGKGFKGLPLSENAVAQSKMLLGLYPCDGYRIIEDRGCLILGWQDRALFAASAWRC